VTADATVAVPVRNAGGNLAALLEAVTAQRYDGEVEVLVCDSGSSDGSAELSRRYGARVIEISALQFGHGRTRNLLMQRSHGTHVAFLTQDTLPVDDRWLERLLAGFAVAPDVGLVFGPYQPRPEASAMVARELTQWFGALSPSGEPRVDRLAPNERDLAPRELLGPRGFFTDANGCVARRAWERVPFRDIAYAEDHALAHDMLRAGYAKVFSPQAAVIHSHDYSPWGWLQRSFDEARALHELYGWREPLHPRTVALNIWGRVGADRRWAQAAEARPSGAAGGPELLLRSALYHMARAAGSALGGHAEQLPPRLVRRLSHERRSV
jgi:GT2 family glycosyltransferase